MPWVYIVVVKMFYYQCNIFRHPNSVNNKKKRVKASANIHTNKKNCVNNKYFDKTYWQLKIIKKCFTFIFTDPQWIQIDIGPPTLITAVITKGRGDSKRSHWVKRFMIKYSNDTEDWTTYKDAHHLDPKVKLQVRTRSPAQQEILKFA